MQYRLLLSLTIGLLCVGAQTRTALASSEASPTTAPSTQPAAFSIQGTVEVEQSWTLQKPDLSRVAVYLASDPALDAKNVPVKVDMEQYRKAFDPDFLIVPRGSTVNFPNRDHFYHNVFSRSRIAPTRSAGLPPSATSARTGAAAFTPAGPSRLRTSATW